MSETTMDDLLTDLTNTKNNLKDLQSEEKTLKQKINELETRIIVNLDAQGVDSIGNDVCTVSIKKEIVPTVEDWDSVHQHIIDTRQFELLQKRMSATAYRELQQMGQEVPGVAATELTRINFRSK
jgi:predicted transcriptional regulator